MTKEGLRKLIQTAGGRCKADVVLKGCKVVNVFSGEIVTGDVALSDGYIAGVGEYHGLREVDASGLYALPGFIDSHIHIESSYVSPEELGRLLVPHGATTIIADPHEIVNVCGIEGLDYMMRASERTALDIKYMLPSCVPATPFEHAGAEVLAADMAEPITRAQILGLGEFMNYPGILNCDEEVLDKLLCAKGAGKLIDGHSPGLAGLDLTAYAAAGIQGDHECSTVEEMRDRLERGMYILLRQGSACHDLEKLLPGVTPENSRRCLLCSDDRQPKTILQEGHIDHLLRMCVDGGLDPVTAVRMATLNAAECFRLYDRGAIAPGYRADIVLVDDLTDFFVEQVWIAGELVSKQGEYLPEIQREPIAPVMGSVRLKDFSGEKLKMHLKSNRVRTIRILPGGVVTGKGEAQVTLDENGEFVFDPARDICKAAVVERHRYTGNVACGFLEGYGIRRGAVALSVAHDSHNIIVAGVSDGEMAAAVQALAAQQGGIVLVENGQVVESLPLPIAGLMTDRDGEWVAQRLESIHEAAYHRLGIHGSVEPVMTLCFMSLPVIPQMKLTDMGLFDVEQFQFVPVEVEETAV